jgi:hypothetical protein
VIRSVCIGSAKHIEAREAPQQYGASFLSHSRKRADYLTNGGCERASRVSILDEALGFPCGRDRNDRGFIEKLGAR